MSDSYSDSTINEDSGQTTYERNLTWPTFTHVRGVGTTIRQTEKYMKKTFENVTYL